MEKKKFIAAITNFCGKTVSWIINIIQAFFGAIIGIIGGLATIVTSPLWATLDLFARPQWLAKKLFFETTAKTIFTSLVFCGVSIPGAIFYIHLPMKRYKKWFFYYADDTWMSLNTPNQLKWFKAIYKELDNKAAIINGLKKEVLEILWYDDETLVLREAILAKRGILNPNWIEDIAKDRALLKVFQDGRHRPSKDDLGGFFHHLHEEGNSAIIRDILRANIADAPSHVIAALLCGDEKDYTILKNYRQTLPEVFLERLILQATEKPYATEMLLSILERDRMKPEIVEKIYATGNTPLIQKVETLANEMEQMHILMSDSTSLWTLLCARTDVEICPNVQKKMDKKHFEIFHKAGRRLCQEAIDHFVMQGWAFPTILSTYEISEKMKAKLTLGGRWSEIDMIYYSK